jgi:hypothetical protein
MTRTQKGLFLLFILLIFNPIINAEEKVNIKALLIGCTKYPYLNKRFWLKGPANDVKQFSEVLQTHPFKIPKKNIELLVGWESNKQTRPSRENIVNAITELAKNAQTNDQIILFFAGHGSQQPCDGKAQDAELDGLDEVFLPADVKNWEDKTAKIPNSISDNELNYLIKAIRKKGAMVWLISDTCHAGTMLRGAAEDVIVTRGIGLGDWNNNYVAKKKKVKKKNLQVILNEEPEELPGAVIAFSAVQSSQKALELPLPKRSDVYRGLFTYSLCEAIASSKGAMSYRILMEKVINKYREKGYMYPQPAFEGNAADRQVLGVKEWPRRNLLNIEKALNGTWILKAGSLHGLSIGTELALFNDTEIPEDIKPLVHARITKCEPLSSKLEFFSKKGDRKNGDYQFSTSLKSIVVLKKNTATSLSLAYQRVVKNENEISTFKSGKGNARIENILNKISIEKNSLFKRVDRAILADWYLNENKGELSLIPVSGIHATRGQCAAVPSFLKLGSVESESIESKLRTSLSKISHVSNILKMSATSVSSSSKHKLDLKLNIMKYNDVNSKQGVKVNLSEESFQLKTGNIVSFNLTNPGNQPLAVYLFFIDSLYGVEMIFPDKDSMNDNIIQAGATLVTPKGIISNDSTGMEHVFAIALNPNQKTDLSILEQASLPRNRTVGEGTAFENLIKQRVYGKTRGFKKVKPVENYAMRSLSWETVKKKL